MSTIDIFILIRITLLIRYINYEYNSSYLAGKEYRHYNFNIILNSYYRAIFLDKLILIKIK
jgi:hypothetical protein